MTSIRNYGEDLPFTFDQIFIKSSGNGINLNCHLRRYLDVRAKRKCFERNNIFNFDLIIIKYVHNKDAI